MFSQDKEAILYEASFLIFQGLNNKSSAGVNLGLDVYGDTGL